MTTSVSAIKASSTTYAIISPFLSRLLHTGFKAVMACAVLSISIICDGSEKNNLELNNLKWRGIEASVLDEEAAQKYSCSTYFSDVSQILTKDLNIRIFGEFQGNDSPEINKLLKDYNNFRGELIKMAGSLMGDDSAVDLIAGGFVLQSDLNKILEISPKKLSSRGLYRLVREIPINLSVKQKRKLVDILARYEKEFLNPNGPADPFFYNISQQNLEILKKIYDFPFVSTELNQQILEKMNKTTRAKYGYLKQLTSNSMRRACLEDINSTFKNFSNECPQQADIIANLVQNKMSAQTDSFRSFDFKTLRENTSCNLVVTRAYLEFIGNYDIAQQALYLLDKYHLVIQSRLSHPDGLDWTKAKLQQVIKALNKLPNQIATNLPFVNLYYLKNSHERLSSGFYYYELNSIFLFEGTITEEVLIHEITHAWDRGYLEHRAPELRKRWHDLGGFQSYKYKDENRKNENIADIELSTSLDVVQAYGQYSTLEDLATTMTSFVLEPEKFFKLTVEKQKLFKSFFNLN